MKIIIGVITTLIAVFISFMHSVEAPPEFREKRQ